MSDSTAQSPAEYRHPPIAEAIIEVRLADALPFAKVEQAAQRLKANYAFISPEQHVGIELDAGKGRAGINTQNIGFQLSSNNRDDILSVRSNALVCGRLAPYCGWAALRERAKRDWDKFKKIIGYQPLSRIGIRYVNRLDIPHTPGTAIILEDYLTIYPKMPPSLDSMISTYAMQVTSGAGVDNYAILVNSGTVPSPLVNYASLALDIDLYRDVQLPTRDDAIWSMIDEMRAIKNSVFEMCVTDKTRSMFDA